MRERGILFSAPMVRAILAGRKTQTRRLMKPQPEPIPADVQRMKPYDDSGFWWACSAAKSMMAMWDAPGACPYGTRGDHLWVRETWRPRIANGGGLIPDGGDVTVEYRADGTEAFFDEARIPDEWMMPKAAGRGDVSPLFMPRWASRITLEVTEVRVQHLCDISEEDAKAEGPLFAIDEEQTVLNPELTDERNTGCYACAGDPNGISELCHPALRGNGRPFACWFATLWDAINGDRAPWSSNPWVWAVSFRVVEPAVAARAA